MASMVVFFTGPIQFQRFRSAFYHFSSFVQCLIEHNIDVNSQEEPSGKTLLHEAVKEADNSAVELLMKYRTSVNAKDYKGNTPLYAVAL